MKYEYVITNGPGTLIEHGICYGISPTWDGADLETLAGWCAVNRWAMQFEPCAEDCGTGR